MEEVFQIADRITVFRDGRLISTRARLEATPQRAIADMVGREIDLTKARTTCARDEVVLSVADLGRRGVFEGVSFDLHRGEVLGFAGLIGAGRTDVGLALFGIEPATSGTIAVAGNPVTVRTARDGMKLGIAYVSEDRRQLGLVLPISIFANITLPVLRRYLNRLGLVRTGLERRTADAFRERLAIRTPSVDLEVAKLSGGNQQKVMLSKWLNTGPSVLILDEPTRGVDVGSKAEVHTIIGQLAAEGIGVIVISSDLPEVLVLSDRVLVMREGRQMAILDRAEANEETIMTAAIGPEIGGLRRRKAVMNWLKRRVRPEQIRELSLLVLILAAVVLFGSFIDNYYSFRTFNRIASSVAIITVVAVGQTLVVLTRNIDLSVGSIAGFTAYFVGTLIANHNGINPFLAVAIAIALGAALGVVNGVIVAWGRVPAVVVTLGTLAIYRGVLVDLSGAKTVTTDSLPQWLINLPLVNVAPVGNLDIRALFMLALVIVVVFQIGTTYLSFARRFYAIGSNPEAAQLIGLPIKGVVFLAFVICGALSGLAGFMLLARFGNITVEAGRGLELSVVAAVVVGGVNVFGGSGTVTGAMLGAVMIGTLEQSLFRLGISEFWLDAVLGLLILLAVASDAVILQRLRQLWAARDEAGREGNGYGFQWNGHIAAMSLLARLKSWETMMLALLVVIVAFNSVGSPYFLSVGNFVNLFQLSIEKSIVALTMALVIIGGEIDLSVASVMGLAACVMAWTFHAGVPMPAAILIALATGILAELNNAFWIARVGLPSLAVTLAGLIGYRGVARILLEDRAIGGFPEWFNTIGQQPLIGPLTAAISIFFVLFVIFAIVLHGSAIGRLVYVVGSNVEAARYSGVRVGLVKGALFVGSAFVAALAGILYAARLGSVRGDMAEGFELDVITAVLLGGVSIFGGKGNLIGVGLALLVILNLRNGMGLADITGNTQNYVIGGLLILSVLIPNMWQELTNKRRGRETDANF